MDDDASATVRFLLDAAGLTMSDEEFASLVGVYPDLRAQSDALNGPEFQLEPPAPVFDPTIQWP